MKVKIYTVDYCPFCRKALEFLKEKGVNFEQIRIDDDETAMRKKLGEMYNIKNDVTVPQIIIDGKHIGGYDDMKRMYEDGELVFADSEK